MRFAIRMLLFAMVFSGCALATRAQPQPDIEKLPPEGQLLMRAWDKAIKDGHVNSVCQDMKGTWEAVEGASMVRVCRLEKGFIEVSPGYVLALQAIKVDLNDGLLAPIFFDCTRRRSYQNQDVLYNSAGRIEAHAPIALGGEWTSIKPGSRADAVRETVCKGAFKLGESDKQKP